MSFELHAVMKAADFAARAHAVQRRNDENRTPYINHLLEVGHLLAEANEPALVVVAGILHDTLEDAAVTEGDLISEFGAAVTDIVRACTDDKSLPVDVRKRQQIEHATTCTDPRVVAVKLADKTSSMRSMYATPPDWPFTRAMDYVRWCDLVVLSFDTSLVNQNLWVQYSFALRDARRYHSTLIGKEENASSKKSST